MLDDGQRRHFASGGYVVVPGVVDEALLDAADAEVDGLVTEAPAPEDTVGAHFHFVSPDRLPACDAALRDTGALAVAEALVAPHRLDHAHDHIQVALSLPPHPHRPGAPHIDGHRPDEEVAPFTMLAAASLRATSTPDRGTLRVWPGPHPGPPHLLPTRR